MVSKFKLVMENAVRPFMENKPAVYLLLILVMTTGGYTATDIVQRYLAGYDVEATDLDAASVSKTEPTTPAKPIVVQACPPIPECPACPQSTITREIIKQPADCQPLIDKSVIKHENQRHG